MKLRATILALTLASAPALAQTPLQELREANPDVEVEIENLAGTVEVTAWDRQQVEVTGTLGRGSERLELDGTPSRLRIEVVLPRGPNRDLRGTDLVIRVPRGASLEVETVSASIRVDGVEGTAELATVSGAIEVLGGIGDTDAASVSGSIRAELSSRARRAEFETVSGSIDLWGPFADDGRYECESVSGSITVRVPAGRSASFEAETFSGGIQNDIGPPAERANSFVPAQELRFSRGSDGTRFSLTSFSGRIRILEE